MGELSIKYNELCAMSDKIPFYEEFGFSANREYKKSDLIKLSQG